MRRIARIAVVAVLAALGAVAAAGSASAQMTWGAYDFTDRFGRPAYSLVHGEPESDNIFLLGECRVDQPQLIDITLYWDTGPNGVGADIGVFVATDLAAGVSRPGRIIDSGEFFGPAISLIIPTTDPIWPMLQAGHTAEIGASNGPRAVISLTGTRVAIDQFLGNCRQLWGSAPPAVPAGLAAALPGPLYLVGAEPLRAFATAPNGAEVAPYPPGAELMATNVTVNVGGVLMAEVVSLRGAGVTAWVERARLIPTSGGAMEYQNLNTVANLSIRSAPSVGASNVASAPPGARGILDLGEREGDFVRVRYAGINGWAAHEYLRPFVAGVSLPPALPSAPPAAEPGKLPAPSAEPPQPGKTPGAAAPPVDASERYLGRWIDPASGGKGPLATLDVTVADGALALASSTGWTATVIWGADGDLNYATGSGTWTIGVLTGQTFGLDVFADPEAGTLTIDLIVPNDGGIETYRFERAAG